MPKTTLSAILQECRRVLRPETFTDHDGAVNGLQVENSGSITKIAAAVDGSLATIKMAIAAEADLLIVHHGLFWTPSTPWTGHRYQMLELLIKNDLAVYSSHLPLDAHPTLGNNAQLCSKLDLENLKPFFLDKGQHLGFQAKKKISRDALAQKLQAVLGRAPIVLPGGPETCQRIGVVTGSAGGSLKQAKEEGIDTLITGEGPHWTHVLAEELGINVFYGGHYATETFGVKALSAHLSERFHVEWEFLDYPSGL